MLDDFATSPGLVPAWTSMSELPERATDACSCDVLSETPVMKAVVDLFDMLSLKMLKYYFKDSLSNETLLYNDIAKKRSDKVVPQDFEIDSVFERWRDLGVDVNVPNVGSQPRLPAEERTVLTFLRLRHQERCQIHGQNVPQDRLPLVRGRFEGAVDRVHRLLRFDRRCSNLDGAHGHRVHGDFQVQDSR